ncbi:sugar transferase [Cohnella sp. GCM10027633]|uniref:sugar transferase n=1 Tax=unclassified Cohnella TaxID=2636738 RepID=UPI003638B2C0
MSLREAELDKDSKLYYMANVVTERAFYNFGKRVQDLVLTSALLVLSLPVFLLIAVVIKWENPKGTVFYKQIRVGHRGKPFYMYKFRSMIPDADKLQQSLMGLNEVGGAMFKMKNDPRVTWSGKWLRKSSLDELPQFVNVLRGDMSLVGPRPPLPREVEQYTAYEKLRLSVIPGCTGVWQVSGRSSVCFDEMVAMDMRYIAERTMWMDLKIIMKTGLLVFRAKDAY